MSEIIAKIFLDDISLYPRQMTKSFTPYEEYIFMTCHKRGLPPTSTIGFGFVPVSSLILVPSPPAKMTAFIVFSIV